MSTLDSRGYEHFDQTPVEIPVGMSTHRPASVMDMIRREVMRARLADSDMVPDSEENLLDEGNFEDETDFNGDGEYSPGVYELPEDLPDRLEVPVNSPSQSEPSAPEQASPTETPES